MSLERWLEFHDSTMLAVRGSADCVELELDGYIHEWKGTGPSRRGSGFIQRVRLTIDFADVDQGIASLPAELSDGSVVCDALVGDGRGGVSLPLLVEGMIDLELVATSGETLKITGERLRAEALGEARFVEELPADMDPQRVPT